MRKIVLAVMLCCLFSLQVPAQEKRESRFGFEYGFEMIDPGVSDLKRSHHYVNTNKYIYIKDFNCHRASILYKQPIYRGIYVEPQLSYYYMEYCHEYDISVNPDYEGPREYSAALISDLVEQGIGASLHIGYNFRIYNKWSVDMFVAPDYRYAIKSNGSEDYDLLEVDKDFGVAVYDPGYIILKGGIGINYGALSLNFSYGKYMSDRFNINKDAMRPEVITLALGFKF